MPFPLGYRNLEPNDSQGDCMRNRNEIALAIHILAGSPRQSHSPA